MSILESESKKVGRPVDLELAAKRRGEILAEAAVLFSEAGYPGTDIQVLADRLGIGKGTVYRYFPTKENLFFAAVDAGVSAMSASIDAAVEGEDNPLEYIRKGVIAYLGYFDMHPELMELLIIERAEFRDRGKGTYFTHGEGRKDGRSQFIRDAIKAGVIRDIPVERVFDFICDALYGVIFTNHFEGRKVSFEKQANDVVDILFHGILTDKGREENS